MSTYRSDLHIDGSETGSRYKLAVELLADRSATIVIDNLLALRPTNDGFLCEVIAQNSKSMSNANKWRKQAEALLERKEIASAIGGSKLTWLVVEDVGSSTVEVQDFS